MDRSLERERDSDSRVTGTYRHGYSMTEESVKVVFCGLGSIGIEAVKILGRRSGIDMVGAIEVDPAKVGHDLGEVSELDRQLGVLVVDDAKRILATSNAIDNDLVTYPATPAQGRGHAEVVSSA